MTPGLLKFLFLLPSLLFAAQNPPRIFLIGLDGATWTLVDPLMRRGILPHMEQCLKRGTKGTLKTLSPTSSPVLWTSIATGKTPAKHRILHFLKNEKKGIPYEPKDRKAAALWNIFSLHKRTVLSVRYMTTHPAEPIYGTLVTDRFHETPQGAAFPPSTEASLNKLGIRNPYNELEGAAQIRRFLSFDWVQDRDVFAMSQEELLIHQMIHNLLRTFRGDEIYVKIAENLLTDNAWDFFAFHLWGTDSVSHEFSRFSEFDPRPTPKNIQEKLGGVLERYYAYADEAVGRLLKYADSKTIIFIVSDHGQSPDLNTPRKKTLSLAEELTGKKLWGHGPQDPGILIACGPGIRENGSLDGGSILDITPTVLYAAGIPAAKDMDGKILFSLFDSEWVKRRPAEWVPSYPVEKIASPAEGAPLSSEELQSLRNVGYIE